jgi:ParB family chromosome partitioning protein
VSRTEETAVRLDAIVVANRHRQYMGDVSTLAKSMADIGLINPVTLTPDGRLVAGARRVQAARVLGWRDIPARYVSTMDDAAAALRGERDENTERLAMRTSELVSLGLALEALERPRAAARKATGQQLGGKARHLASRSRDREANGDGPPGQTREIVAAALGLGETSYRRAKVVVAAASDPDATPEQRRVAQEALTDMDATGNVAGNYAKVRAKTNGPTVDEARTQRRAITKAVAHLEGVTLGLERLGAIHPSITREEAAQWVDDLSKSRRSLERLINRLREYSNAQA